MRGFLAMFNIWGKAQATVYMIWIWKAFWSLKTQQPLKIWSLSKKGVQRCSLVIVYTNLKLGAELKGDVYGLKVSIMLSGAVYDSAYLPHG